jgi:hypothetical protein
MFFCWNLPRIYHSKKNSWSPSTYGEHEYEVEDILDSRILNFQLQYFVHWHGCDVSERTWEPIQNLSNVMEKVHEFHQWYPNKPKYIPCEICH